jgi:hypothetical protein
VAQIRIEIPKSLGLTDEQQNQLQEKFANQLVETLRGTDTAEAIARAKAQVVPKHEKVETIPVVVVDRE